MKKIWLVMTLMIIGLASIAYAAPENVSSSDTTVVNIGEGTQSAATTVSADPGNVTHLDVAHDAYSQYWSAFFGNLSVTVSLTDGTTSFYSWATDNAPTGELLFARAPVDWANLDTGDGYELTEQVVNGMANDTSSENYTNTYVSGAHSPFSIAPYGDLSAAAPRVIIDTFETVLVWDTTNSQGVYAALIKSGTAGYDGTNMDFQTMLPTDGAATDYYVYAEM